MKIIFLLKIVLLTCISGCSVVKKDLSHENVIIKMVNAIDAKEWKTAENQFDEYVFVDYSSMNNLPGQKIKSKDLVSNWKKILMAARTHHMLTNFEVEKFGDRTEIFSHVYASHDSDDVESWDIYGRYHHKLVNKDGQWKIVFMKLIVHGQKGNLNFLNELNK